MYKTKIWIGIIGLSDLESQKDVQCCTLCAHHYRCSAIKAKVFCIFNVEIFQCSVVWLLVVLQVFFCVLGSFRTTFVDDRMTLCLNVGFGSRDGLIFCSPFRTKPDSNSIKINRFLKSYLNLPIKSSSIIIQSLIIFN